MRGDGEGTPLLRGRAAGGELDGGAAAVQQPAPVEGRSRFVPPEQPPLLSRARSRPLLLAVAAVGAAVLVIAVGLMSTSGQAGSPQAGGTSLAAGEVGVGGRDTEGSGAGAGAGERGGSSKAAGGGWRSQADRSPGTM